MASLTAALSDRYHIEGELGAGGMATVYLAHDVKHNRRVAIKVLHPDLAISVGPDRFLAEIRTTANLQHPHILPLFDSGSVVLSPAPGGGSRPPGEALFYVMPYIEGESLRGRLNREKQLPLDDALQIMREVADALDYAHRGGIVHRDIKPENILLSGGHAIVADFGIARAVGDENATRLTQTGAVVGTPAYLSPEQVTGEPLDGRSDIYSLGCVLYECLTGEIPFAGPAMSTLAQRVVSPPPSVRARRTETPPQIEQLVAKAMATQTTDRFQTGREMILALTSPLMHVLKDDRRAIVVLPFANQSPDADNEYFSDGLTEEIISDLAGIKSLSVISRTSSMQLKGTAKDIRTIGRELGVRYVLEGSVRKAGNSLRITSRLIDAASDAQVWGEKYSGTLDDVFEVQERVAREIVKALDVTLSPQEERHLANRPIGNVRAFEFYLQARQALQRYQLDRGTALLQQAIAIEGEVPALRALRAYGWFALARMGENREGPLAQAEAEAEALIRIAPDAPYGYALRGFAGYERGNLSDAVRSFRAALARDPNDADVLFYLGISLQAAGQPEDSAAAGRRLIASDPLSAFAELLTGANSWFVGRASEGVGHIERGLGIDPESMISHWALGYNYALAAMLVEADSEARWMQQHGPQLPYTAQLRGLVAALDGRKDEALQWLRQVDETRLDAHHTFHLGESFAMAGDTAHALELVERAVDNGFYPYEFIAVHCPFMAPLRGSAEFERILAKAKRRVVEFSASVRS